LTDQELIRGFLDGGKTEHDLVREWISSMVETRLWDGRISPDDVISDTVLKVLLNLRDDSFRLESSLKTYVQRIALYTLVDAGRRERRHDPMAEDTATIESETPHTRLEDAEERELIDRAISILPESCRKLLAMVLLEGMRYKDIAAQLSSSEGAIKTRFSRCRDRLEELIRKMT
jgi:RNA polymerase sigma-70 factor, ECF subfamily